MTVRGSTQAQRIPSSLRFTPPPPTPPRKGEGSRCGERGALDRAASLCHQRLRHQGSASLQDFAYECPKTIEEAVAAMRGGDARALAGGTDLIPQMREGRRCAARVVDLKGIPELIALSVQPD